MRIVDLKTLRSLPCGTIAMKYEPCIFGRLFVLREILEDDFILEYITDNIDCGCEQDFIDTITSAEEKGISIAMSFEETMRDGFFEEKQLFAIWEKPDVQGLIHKLNWCLEKAYNKAFNLTKAEG